MAELPLIGREDAVKQLWQRLKTRSTVLTGLPGVGKTALARQLVAAPAEPWRVLYASLPGGPPQAATALQKSLRKRRAKLAEHPTLLILDGLVHDDVERLLPLQEDGVRLLLVVAEGPTGPTLRTADRLNLARFNLFPLGPEHAALLFAEALGAREILSSPEAGRHAWALTEGMPSWLLRLAGLVVAPAAEDPPLDYEGVEAAAELLLKEPIPELSRAELMRRYRSEDTLSVALILDVIARTDDGLHEGGLSAQALMHGLAPARTRALAARMVDEGLISRDPHSGLYRFLLPLQARWWLRNGLQ